MYRIEGTNMVFDTMEEAREELEWIQDAGQAELMEVLRKHLRSIKDRETCTNLSLAYLSIMDALLFMEDCRESGDDGPGSIRDSYIKEVEE